MVAKKVFLSVKRNEERKRKCRGLRAAPSLVMEHLKAGRECVYDWPYHPTAVPCPLFTMEQRPGRLAMLFTHACPVHSVLHRAEVWCSNTQKGSESVTVSLASEERS